MSRLGLVQALRSFRADRSGANAVEFALVLPVMLALLFGGYQLCQGVAAYRKVTLTARTVADLTTQYASMGSSDVSNVLNASAQIMVPYPIANLTIVLTEFSTPASGPPATVTWSQTLNGTALKQGATVILPVGVCQPGNSVIRADVTYVYTPVFGYAVTGSYTMRDTIYMSPRQVQSVAYTGN